MSISIKVCTLWIRRPSICVYRYSQWAKFRQRKAAVKMHTLLDWHGNIPTFIRVTSRDVHDVNILDEIMPEAGAFYVMDRGYIDFQRLFVFTLSSAFFVVRTRGRKSYLTLSRTLSSLPSKKKSPLAWLKLGRQRNSEFEMAAWAFLPKKYLVFSIASIEFRTLGAAPTKAAGSGPPS